MTERERRELDSALRAIDYSSVPGNAQATPVQLRTVLAYVDGRDGAGCDCAQHAWLRKRLAS